MLNWNLHSFSGLFLFCALALLPACNPFGSQPGSEIARDMRPGVVAAHLLILEGDGQSDLPLTTLGTQPKIQVLDKNNIPIFDFPVTFFVAEGGGTLDGGSDSRVVRTDIFGSASVSWTLGSTGAQTLTASVDAAPLSISVSAVARLYEMAIVSGNSQVHSANTSLPISPTVRLVDSNGNPAAGQSVHFSVVSGGGSLNSSTATTSASGEASVIWTLGATPGANSLTVTHPNVDGSLTFTATGVNDAPTLTTVSTLGGAIQNTAFSIPFATLLAASDAADINGDVLSFRVESVTSGTLTLNGVAVVPGTTFFNSAETLVWQPAAASYGTIAAFTVKAYDQSQLSSSSVAVSVSVTQTNHAPTLTAISTLGTDAYNADFTISYATLLAASNAADTDGDTLSFRVEAVSSGTLTKGGVAVSAGSTLLSTGESLVWTPASNATGTRNAFTVKVYDGIELSSSAVQVKVMVNSPPTLSTISTLGTDPYNTDYTISYAALLAASDAADSDSDAISFQIQAVSTGTLTKSGTAVTAGTTTLASGESLVWTPALNASGTLNAFIVRAYDGRDTSSAVQVKVFVNTPPTLTTISTLGTTRYNTALSITYAVLFAASNAADSNGDTLSFSVQAVSTGTLTKSGVAVTAGTLISSGDTVVWTPASNAAGTLNAFTVKAYDGVDTSASSIQVQVAVNHPPSVSGPADTLYPLGSANPPVTQGTAKALSWTATDADGDTMAMSCVYSTPGLSSSDPNYASGANCSSLSNVSSITSSSGAYSFTFTPAVTQRGVYRFTVTATDSNSDSNYDDVYVTVRENYVTSSLVLDLDAMYASPLAALSSTVGAAANAVGCTPLAWTDLSSTANATTFGGFSTCTSTNGWFGTGTTASPYQLGFNGSTDYVQVPRNVSDDFSLEAWFKTTATAHSGGHWWAGGGIIDGEVNGNVGDFGLSLNGSQVSFGLGNSDTTISSTRYANYGKWQHAVATRVKSTGALTLYLNGVQVATGTGPTNSQNTPTYLHIGSIQTNTYYFTGSIPVVRVYSKALSASEVTQNYSASEPRFLAPTSCKDIKTDYSAAPDGVYTIDPDGAGGLAPFSAYCDMTTDSGGWTLVANYLHKGGTNPALNARSSDLPLFGSTVLGTDESGSTTWGHITNAMTNKFSFTESRWYCKSSANARVMHFKTSLAGVTSYLKTGTGTMSGLQTSGNYTTLTGHTANLPASIANFYTNQGNSAMTEFPFWLSGTYHWGIRGLGTRWECDDYNNSSTYNTYHQIWLR